MSERRGRSGRRSVAGSTGAVMRGLVAAGAVVVLDAAAAVGGAVLLWNGGGATVVDGAWLHRAGCVAGVAVLLLSRGAVARGRARMERIVVGAETAVLAALVAVWTASGLYFVGWLATFSAFLLALGSLWHLLALLVARAQDGAPDAASAAPAPKSALVSTRALAVGAGLLTLVVLSPVHLWDAGIVSGLIVLVSGAVFLSFGLRLWLSALRSVSNRSPDPFSAPEGVNHAIRTGNGNGGGGR